MKKKSRIASFDSEYLYKKKKEISKSNLVSKRIWNIRAGRKPHIINCLLSNTNVSTKYGQETGFMPFYNT